MKLHLIRNRLQRDQDKSLSLPYDARQSGLVIITKPKQEGNGMDQEKGRFKTQVAKLNDSEAVIKVVQRNGEVIDFLIDSKNIPLVERYKWFSHVGYCCRLKNNRQWPLSWELFGKPPKGYLYHHLNGDRKDCRKSNLRMVTWSVNNLLKKTQENCSTGLRGVSRYADGSFVAIIGVGNKRKCFKNLRGAIKARKRFENTMSALINTTSHTRVASNQ